MTRGHVIFAQNSDINYVRQAYALALSIKKYNKINQVCLITNDPIPIEYIQVFDHVVPIPWKDMSKDSEWKIENRWKIIHCTPFKENLVYDSDMLLLGTNDHYWYHLENYDIALTEHVTNYKGTKITCKNNPYRRVFEGNNLPDIYFGLHYFKKNKVSYEFYKWLEIIIKNWDNFAKNYTKISTQKTPSLDVASSLALQFGDFNVKNDILSFTHMKPLIQDWESSRVDLWHRFVNYHVNKNFEIYIGNHAQTGLLHYVEDGFLTDEIIGCLNG
jgi:hypothetical protein